MYRYNHIKLRTAYLCLLDPSQDTGHNSVDLSDEAQPHLRNAQEVESHVKGGWIGPQSRTVGLLRICRASAVLLKG